MSFGVALHAMLVLARDPHRRMSSTQIASSVGANPVTVRRALGLLVEAGLVETQPGPGGGAALAKPPHTIAAGEIYRAVGRPAWIEGHENPPNRKCDVSVSMPRIIHRLDQAIDERARPVLDEVTLQSLLDEEILRR
ncbi:MAG: Rrf2 family transcriptional regulator [Myxococcota bacterium]